jgi:hypothetical protein
VEFPFSGILSKLVKGVRKNVGKKKVLIPFVVEKL